MDPTSSLISLILWECHSTPIAGHGGIQKPTAHVCAAFTWTSLKKDVKKFVKECEVCQKMKYSNQAPRRLIQPSPIPNKIWEDLVMDLIMGLPNSEGHSILVVVDRLSKQAHFGALPRSYYAPCVAHLFSTMVYKLHWIPKSIVSDRDAIFLSKFWCELFTLSGTLMLRRRTTYHL